MILLKNYFKKYLITSPELLDIKVTVKRGELVITPIEIETIRYNSDMLPEMVFIVFNLYGLFKGYNNLNLSQVKL